MILPGVANITTAANHTFEAMSLGNGNWIVTSYSKANGTAISGASALVLLSTVTASTSATVDIETTFNSTYDKYVLEVTGLVPDTSNQNLKCLQKLTGTYETANYDWEIEATSPQSVTNTYRSFVERTSAAINITTTLSDSTDGVTNFTLFISVPASTTLKKYLYWYGVCNDNANVLPAKMSGVGGNTSTGALTGLRFFLSSGNILSGTFRLYGIAKS